MKDYKISWGEAINTLALVNFAIILLLNTSTFNTNTMLFGDQYVAK